MQQSHFRVDTGSGLGSPSRTNNENEKGVCVTLPGAAAGAGEVHPGGKECGGSEQDADAWQLTLFFHLSYSFASFPLRFFILISHFPFLGVVVVGDGIPQLH